jgi:hypothetical protein
VSEKPQTPTDQQHKVPQTLLEAVRYFADETGRTHRRDPPMARWASLPARQALLKRALNDTYVSVRPEHLDAYVVEQVRRYNSRHDQDGGRFVSVLTRTEGKRLTYEGLIRKS